MRIWSVLIVLILAVPAFSDSLFTKDVEEKGGLIVDKKQSFEVGDIIIVQVMETVNASTEADTSTDKQSKLQAKTPLASNDFLVNDTPAGLNILSPGMLPNWKIDVQNEHEATGSTERSNKLIMTVSCEVKEVLKNGYLELEGSKKITVNREDSTMKVSGRCRPKDVTTGNTLMSAKMSNVEIELIGRGPLWNNARRGLLTKLLDWFSPF